MFVSSVGCHVYTVVGIKTHCTVSYCFSEIRLHTIHHRMKIKIIILWQLLYTFFIEEQTILNIYIKKKL